MPTVAVDRPSPRIEVVMDAEAHRPCAVVPAAWLWDLVEFLSFHRVAVRYQYRVKEFVVHFEQTSLSVAQQLLDDWTHSSNRP